jgi:uncharacterized protein (UPF0305 family)
MYIKPTKFLHTHKLTQKAVNAKLLQFKGRLSNQAVIFKARGAFSQDPKMKKKYEELYKVKLVEHVRDLKQFLKNETDLKEEHINFVTNRLRTYERKVTSLYCVHIFTVILLKTS